MSSFAEMQAELFGRIRDAQAAAAFYKRLYLAAYTLNGRNSCACRIDHEAGDVIAPCQMHADWRAATVEAALRDAALREYAPGSRRAELPEPEQAASGSHRSAGSDEQATVKDSLTAEQNQGGAQGKGET